MAVVRTLPSRRGSLLEQPEPESPPVVSRENLGVCLSFSRDTRNPYFSSAIQALPLPTLRQSPGSVRQVEKVRVGVVLIDRVVASSSAERTAGKSS
ncbi:hypothetical protein HPB50_023872 [Hyalomma asiaticum]|uniref:Uncharacterized protein n=1 Tax=Hyalomma asiaticum TaxID=266040 RepID=A0ACB7SXN0_HYAAI|nr:hypothetical protein HPB50_023872 [Hyalomma asiaticum]